MGQEVELELVGDDVQLGVDLEPEAGSSPSRLIISLPRSTMGLLDTRTSALASAVAAIEGRPAPGGGAPAGLSAPSWVGLAYDASADAAAALVELLPSGAITHLLTRAELDGHGRPIGEKALLGIEALARELGLRHLRIATNARQLAGDRGRLNELDSCFWATVGRVLPAFTEILAPDASDDPLSTAARDARVLGRVIVCEDPSAPPNCGRCPACVIALTRLEARSITPPTGLFRRELSEDAVTQCARDGELVELLLLVASIPDERTRLRRLWTRALGARLERRGASSPWSTDVVSRVAAAAARTGVRLTGDAAFGWRPGEVPLRPERNARHELLRSVDDRAERPVQWAMLDSFGDRSRATWCAAQLHDGWGSGLVWGYGPDGEIDRETLARTLRQVSIRVWWTEAAGLDAARVLETIEHGCLPLQAMSEVTAEITRAALPERLRDLVLAMGDEPPSPFTDGEIEQRLRAAVAELIAGSLERDLAIAARGGG